MGKHIQRLAALIRKETIQLLRDRRTVGIIIALPLIELFLFAYAVHLTIDHLPTVVADQSKDNQSRALITALADSKYFDIVGYVDSQRDVTAAIDAGRAKVGLVIPPDFATAVARGDARAQMVFDGSDSMSMNTGYGAALAVAQARALELVAEKTQRMGLDLQTSAITTSTLVLYNPSMSDLVYILPAILAMLLQMASILTTAAAIVREHELGTIEQLLATPARPFDLVVGKLVPNVLLMLFVLAITTLTGTFYFGVPFRGSPWLFVWLSLLAIVCGLGLGLLISTIAHTQKEALQAVMLLTMLSLLLTGFIFPRSNMPLVVRLIGNLLPLTYFIRITRGIITKGIGLTFMWSDVVALLVYGVLIMTLAAMTSRKRLD